MSTAQGTTTAVVDPLKPHIKPKTLIGYGMGDAGCNIAFQMTGLFLLVFYTDVVGLRPEHSSMIFLFIKIWDAFADLFAGRMVDSTMTRWGKFRPFILWYSVPLLLSNLLCFWIPVDGYGAKLAWATISYALMGLLYSMVNIPYGSLAGAMTQNPVDRSKLAAARMVGSGFTILILAVVLAPQIKAAENLQLTFLITAVAFLVVGTIFFMICFATTKEIVTRDVEKVTLKETVMTVGKNGPLLRLCLSSLAYLTGQNVVSGTAIYVANDMLGKMTTGNWMATVVTIITTGAVLYMGPFGPMLTKRLGKKHSFLGSALLAAAGAVVFWIGNVLLQSLVLSLIGLFIVGASMAMLNTMTWALEADTVEYGEWKTGIRTEGATYSAFSFTRKVGQGIGLALSGLVLSWAMYDADLKKAGLPQSPETLNSMAMWFVIFAAGCFILAALIMASYPLTEARFQEIMREIQERRAKGINLGAQTAQQAHGATDADPNGPTDRS